MTQLRNPGRTTSGSSAGRSRNAQILRTTDGFATFEVQLDDDDPDLRCVGFADASRG
jgi:hypothetical protein